jgi:hypothetical protein
LTDFSTPLSKKVIILLNRAIREEKEEEKEKALERSVEASSQNGSTNDCHPSTKQEEAGTSETSPQPRRQKKSVLGRMDQFQASMPSPYSPTSFSKVRLPHHRGAFVWPSYY